MGPNTKKISRAQYVNRRLRILEELFIAPPPPEKIAAMMDESRMSETAVDAVFLACIQRSGRH